MLTCTEHPTASQAEGPPGGHQLLLCLVLGSVVSQGPPQPPPAVLPGTCLFTGGDRCRRRLPAGVATAPEPASVRSCRLDSQLGHPVGGCSAPAGSPWPSRGVEQTLQGQCAALWTLLLSRSHLSPLHAGQDHPGFAGSCPLLCEVGVPAPPGQDCCSDCLSPRRALPAHSPPGSLRLRVTPGLPVGLLSSLWTSSFPGSCSSPALGSATVVSFFLRDARGDGKAFQSRGPSAFPTARRGSSCHGGAARSLP